MNRVNPPINAVWITNIHPPSITSVQTTQTISYVVGWYGVDGNSTSFHRAPQVLPWRLGSGNITIVAPAAYTPQQIQLQVLTSIETVEQLVSGDVILLPDLSVITL